MYWSLMLVALVASCAASTNPCDPANHIELDEPYRSASFKVEFPEEPLCDLHLEEGWYRFTSQAGGTIPTTCQANYQCGTIAPIWMQGTLPQESDGEVIRTACVNFNTGSMNCCEKSREITVRNCGGFFVYYLYPTPACPLSYCAGDEAPCPVGKWSPTSFPPCEDAYPIMKIPPTLLGPVIDLPNNDSFSFLCQVSFTGNASEPRFEVSWLFDGQEDANIPPEILSDPSIEAKLDGSKLGGHLNQIIECQVRSYLVGNENHKSGYLRSNAYYAGVQVSPAKLVYGAEDWTKSVNLTSTLPIVCNSDFDCCLQFYVDENGKNDIAISTACKFELCPKDWNYENSSASIEINVAAKTMMAEVNKQLLLLFDELLPTGGAYQNAFFGARPNEVQIALEDRETYTCKATGDPHFTSFDGVLYHLYLVGEFTAVEVPDRYFEIQIRTWRCNFEYSKTVTCICGIIIREENDIILIDECGQTYKGANTSPVISSPSTLQEGTVVERSSDGAHIGVYLRSGTEVKIDATNYYINMIITLPSTDKDKAKGICGTNNGIKGNEFERPNGDIDRICDDCTPDTFFESWRADGVSRKSLFESVPDPVEVVADNRYCTCQKENIICDATQKVVHSGTACSPHCSPQNVNNGGGWQKKRDVVYEDFDEPDVSYVERDISSEDLNHNKTWSTREEDGITEAQARDMCLKAIQKSQLSTRIDESSELFQSTMINCLADILYTEDIDFLDATTTAITAASQVELAKDPANYVTDSTGKPVIKAEFTEDICDVSCEKHGHCGETGGCVCDPGWEGFTCHIESGKGPLLDRIRSGPLCDIGERPCKKIYTDVSNINLSDKLMCRVQPVDEDGNSTGPPVHTEAISLSAYRISCALPETVVSHERYKISASNDGTLFGNELSLLVFNSLCMDCNNETVCSTKTSACHIDRKCYRDGHINEDDSTQMCEISKATDVWSDVPTTTPIPTTTTTTTPIPTTTTTTTPIPTTTTTTTTTNTTTVPTPTTVLTTTPVSIIVPATTTAPATSTTTESSTQTAPTITSTNAVPTTNAQKTIVTTTSTPAITRAPTSTAVLTSTTVVASTVATKDVSNPCLKNSLFDGQTSHPTDCNKFISCVSGLMYIMDCPSGLWFDIDTKACQWPDDANCPASNE